MSFYTHQHAIIKVKSDCQVFDMKVLKNSIIEVEYTNETSKYSSIIIDNNGPYSLYHEYLRAIKYTYEIDSMIRRAIEYPYHNGGIVIGDKYIYICGIKFRMSKEIVQKIFQMEKKNVL